MDKKATASAKTTATGAKEKTGTPKAAPKNSKAADASTARTKPGAAAPDTGHYHDTGKPSHEIDATKGRAMPPTATAGHAWKEDSTTGKTGKTGKK